MSGGGQEQLLLVLHDFLRGDAAKVHHPLVGTGDPCHEDLQPTPVLELVFDRLTVAHGQREGGMAAFHDLRRVPGQFHRGPIPLAYPAIEIQNDDAVGAGVGHCLLMEPLTVELFVGQRVADGHTSMRREQFEELDFDVADLAAAVERVQGAVGATVDVRHAQGDGVQTGQVGPDQVLQSPSVLVGQQNGLATAQQLTEQAGLQGCSEALQFLRQVGDAHQFDTVLVEQDETAGVRPGEFGDTAGDTVQDRSQAQVGVDVHDHVRESSYQPGTLHRCGVDMRLVFTREERQHPADRFLGLLVTCAAGADAYVQHLVVLAYAPREDGQWGPCARLFQHRAVFGHQLDGDDRQLTTEHLLLGPTEHALGGRVPGGDPEFVVDGDHSVGGEGQYSVGAEGHALGTHADIVPFRGARVADLCTIRVNSVHEPVKPRGDLSPSPLPWCVPRWPSPACLRLR